MRMRKLIVKVLALLFLATSIGASQGAVPKAGSVCSKKSEFQIYKNVKFTCIQQGKKLLWNKGVSIVAPAPKKSLTSLEEATLAFQAVSKKSFNEIKKSLQAESEKKISVEYRNTENFPKSYFTKWKSQIETTLRYLSLFLDSPQKAVYFLTTEKDRDYMLKTGYWNSQNIIYYEPKFQMWDSGQALDNCASTAAWFLNDRQDNQLKLFAGVALPTDPKPGNQSAWCDRSPSHEMFHTIQDYWLTEKQGSSVISALYESKDIYDAAEIPIFREGSTDALTTPMVSQNYEEHFKATFDHYRGVDGSLKSLKEIKTRADVVSYMQTIERRSNIPDAHPASYFLGNLFFDYMISKYQLPKYIELVKATSYKKNFRDVFKSVYGESLDSAYEEASQHILNGLIITRSN